MKRCRAAAFFRVFGPSLGRCSTRNPSFCRCFVKTWSSGLGARRGGGDGSHRAMRLQAQPQAGEGLTRARNQGAWLGMRVEEDVWGGETCFRHVDRSFANDFKPISSPTRGLSGRRGPPSEGAFSSESGVYSASSRMGQPWKHRCRAPTPR